MNDVLPVKIQDYYERIQRLRMIDDDFMKVVFSDRGCVKKLLDVIMNKDIDIISHCVQYSIENLHGHSIEMDIIAKDKDGMIYDIEVQKDDNDDCIFRARYYSSMLDSNLLPKSMDYESLPESHIIFITEKDVIGDGLPKYSSKRRIEETGKPLYDKENIIFINSSYQDQSELGKMMHDFYCTKADDMYDEVLRERVKYLKENKEGLSIMCKIMEEIREEGKHEVIVEIVKRMLLEGEDIEKISFYTHLSVEEIRQYA